MNEVKKPKLIHRYSASQRINHWIIAITFILLTVTGLAFFHPSFYWLSNLLGGGVWSRILHPFIGVLMFLCFAVLALRLWGYNRITRDDIEWMKHAGDVLNNRDDNLPEVGRYNGGQKVMFFIMVLLMIGLLLSGIVMWRAYFSEFFPIWGIRLASVLHALFAFLLICAIIVHVYAAIWVKGTVRAMTRGTVTQGWAWKHHRGWFRQQVRSDSNLRK